MNASELLCMCFNEALVILSLESLYQGVDKTVPGKKEKYGLWEVIYKMGKESHAKNRHFLARSWIAKTQEKGSFWGIYAQRRHLVHEESDANYFI